MQLAISGLTRRHLPHFTKTTAVFTVFLSTVIFPRGAISSPDFHSEVLREEMMQAAMKHDPEGLVIRSAEGTHERVLHSHRRTGHRPSVGPASGETTRDSTLTSWKRLPHSVMIRDFDDAGR